jgi:hypothetical protein
MINTILVSLNNEKTPMRSHRRFNSNLVGVLRRDVYETNPN